MLISLELAPRLKHSFMLNSTEQKNSTAHKNKTLKNKDVSFF